MEKNADTLEEDIRVLVRERNELRERLTRFRPDRGGRGRRQSRINNRITGRMSGEMLRTIAATERQRGMKRDRQNQVQEGARVQSQPAQTEQAPVNSDAFPVEKRPKIDLDAPLQTRSKKLFGSLLGHLKRAKTTLDKEKDTKQAELHTQQEERVSKKLKNEKHNLEELIRRDRRERKRQDADRIRHIQKEIAAKDIELLRVNLENHYTRMANFIRTRAEPTLFWLPAVHTEATRTLQRETKMAIDHKIASLRQQLQAELETLENEHTQKKNTNISSQPAAYGTDTHDEMHQSDGTHNFTPVPTTN